MPARIIHLILRCGSAIARGSGVREFNSHTDGNNGEEARVGGSGGLFDEDFPLVHNALRAWALVSLLLCLEINFGILLKFVCCWGIKKAFPRAEKSRCGDNMMMAKEAGYQFCLLLSASRMNVRQQVKGTRSRRHSVTTFQRWKLSIGVCLLSVSLPDANFRLLNPQ